MTFKFITTTMLLLICATAFGGVYKWIDSEGRIHYSDKPPATGAESLDIKSRPTDPQRIATAAALNTEAASNAEAADAEEAAAAQRQAEEKARRVENCTRARRALDSMLSATRIFEPLPGGERRYLEEAEIAERMSAAKRDVDEWCNKKP